MKAIINFILAPFRFIAETWRDGPGGQWICVLMVLTMALVGEVILFGAFSCYNYVIVEGTVKTGTLVDKWYEPEHNQWTGKFWITVPNRCHVVIRGKNYKGDIHDRDIVVYPGDFEEMKLNQSYTFK